MTDNEMIMRYMDWIWSEDEHVTQYEIKTADYATSWTSLMRVIEKISQHVYEKMTHPHPGFEGQVIITYDRAYPRTFGLMSDEEVPRFMFRFNRAQLHFGATLIECAYAATVQWIKDYNEGLYPKHPTP